MAGDRKALIVATDAYEHEALRRLRSPAADARALARVLGDPGIGDFRVDVVLNESAHQIEEQLEDLFAESRPEDLVLVHFSCHGLKSESGELFFAASNTRPDRLGSTAIPATFVQRCISSCRARNVVVLLDCCYGGAFSEGVTVRASGSAHVLDSFPSSGNGGGRSRAVITASSAMEYAFEGTALAEDHQQKPSLFTSALVHGLESGEADRDEDGWVSLNELYEYVYDTVRSQNPHQTPSRDVEMQGELYVARSRRKRVRPVPIPDELRAALADANMYTRLGAVSELRGRLLGDDVGMALGAHEALRDVVRADIKFVADGAADALAGAAVSASADHLDFGEVEVGSTSPPSNLRVVGPAITRASSFSTDDPWLRLAEVVDGVQVVVEATEPGPLRGTITVTGPTGSLEVPVSALATTPRKAQVGAAPAEPDELAARQEPAALPDDRPVDAPTLTHTARWSSIPGWLTVVGGALMVIGVYLPFQWGDPMSANFFVPIWFLWLIGLMAMAGGALSLAGRPTVWTGPGATLATAATATWGAGLLTAYPVTNGWAGLEVGYVVEAVALLLVVAAGVLVGLRLVRDPRAVFHRPTSGDWPRWAVLALSGAGAVVMVLIAIDVAKMATDVAVLTMWSAVLAVGVPTLGAMLRPYSLGGTVVVTWLIGGVALAVTYHQLTLAVGDFSPSLRAAYLLSLVAIAAVLPFWAMQYRGRASPAGA